jgi:hypothetical protein
MVSLLTEVWHEEEGIKAIKGTGQGRTGESPFSLRGDGAPVRVIVQETLFPGSFMVSKVEDAGDGRDLSHSGYL